MRNTAPFGLSICLCASTILAQPRVWIVDQDTLKDPPNNPNNRIFEIDPINKKNPPDAEGDVIVLNTLPSPAIAFCDELTFDNEDRLWVVVKHTAVSDQDGITRIDKETGDIELELHPTIPGHKWGGILEGADWDGVGLWISAARSASGQDGNILSRFDATTGQRIAPFDNPYGRIGIPGNRGQGLLYDPTGSGYGHLWHTDHGLKKIYKLDISRLYDDDPNNDHFPVAAEFSLPFSPKGIAWMEDKIWISSPRDGIYEFDPATGTSAKIFSTPLWTVDGIAVLPPEPPSQIVLTPTAINHTIFIGQNPPPDSFTVTDGAAATLNYTILDNAPWLSVDPAWGRSTGESDPINIDFTLSQLDPGEYSAVITVSSPRATNSPQTISVTVTIKTVGPDLDGDTDVDQEDFGLFQACFSGQDVDAAPGCAMASFDGDSDVDAEDFILFQACSTAPGVRAVGGCDQ